MNCCLIPRYKDQGHQGFTIANLGDQECLQIPGLAHWVAIRNSQASALSLSCRRIAGYTLRIVVRKVRRQWVQEAQITQIVD